MQASLRLHIGSGRTRIAGFVNVDQIPGCDPQLDLNRIGFRSRITVSIASFPIMRLSTSRITCSSSERSGGCYSMVAGF
jgi:hypothetical protein